MVVLSTPHDSMYFPSDQRRESKTPSVPAMRPKSAGVCQRVSTTAERSLPGAFQRSTTWTSSHPREKRPDNPVRPSTAGTSRIRKRNGLREHVDTGSIKTEMTSMHDSGSHKGLGKQQAEDAGNGKDCFSGSGTAFGVIDLSKVRLLRRFFCEKMPSRNQALFNMSDP